MAEALELTPGRAGNVQRRRLLKDSRDEPWSEAERSLHQIYRGLALPHPYATNFWLSLRDGRRVALDLALPKLRLGFEVDGYEFHGTRTAFEYDRDRDSDLASQGWHVVRFGAAFIVHSPLDVGRRMLDIVAEREKFLTNRR